MAECDGDLQKSQVSLIWPAHRPNRTPWLWAPVWEQQSKESRDIKEGMEWSGIRARAERAAFSQTEVLAETTVPLLGFSSAGMCNCHVWVPHNLANTFTLPATVIPWDTAQPKLLAHPSWFQSLFHTNGLLCLTLWTFSKSLKGSQTPHKQHLA